MAEGVQLLGFCLVLILYCIYVVSMLSGLYSMLYRFRRVPWGGRRQDSVRVSVKCMQPLSTVWLELGKLLSPELVLWPLCV